MNNIIKRTKILLLACVVLVAIALVSLLIGWLYQLRHPPLTPPNDDPLVETSAFSIQSTEEKDGMVVVTTSYGSFRYPSDFADTMSVQAGLEDEIPTLRFSLALDAGNVALFSIRYGGEEGIPCGTFQAEAGAEIIPVYVVFQDPSNLLDTDDRVAFEAAQELFNDIVASMADDDRFTGL